VKSFQLRDEEIIIGFFKFYGHDFDWESNMVSIPPTQPGQHKPKRLFRDKLPQIKPEFPAFQFAFQGRNKFVYYGEMCIIPNKFDVDFSINKCVKSIVA